MRDFIINVFILMTSLVTFILPPKAITSPVQSGQLTIHVTKGYIIPNHTFSPEKYREIVEGNVILVRDKQSIIL
jgi:hypothetical protein